MLLPLQFIQGLYQLFGIWRAVVPLHGVLHVAHTLALSGVGDQHGGLAGGPVCGAQRVGQRRVVMAIYLAHAPAKGGEFVGQRLDAKGLVHSGQALQLVVVDDSNQVIQAVVCGEQQGLPVAAFAQLAVAEQHKGLPVGAHALGGERLAHTKGQAVAQRAGGELHTLGLVADVIHQYRAVLAIGQQVVGVEKAALSQRSVHGHAGVALAEDEAVASRRLGLRRVHVEHLTVEHGNDIADGQRAGDVRSLGAVHHMQRLNAHAAGQCDGVGHGMGVLVHTGWVMGMPLACVQAMVLRSAASSGV